MRKIRFIFQKEYPQSLDKNQWQRILKEAQCSGFNCFFLKVFEDIDDKKLEEILAIPSQLDFFIELEDSNPWGQERKGFLLNSQVNLFWLTFYGLIPETHNKIKNKNDYQITLEKLEYLKNERLPFGFRYVLTKENFNEIFELPKFLQNLNCFPRQIIVEEISPLEGKIFNQELLIYPEQL